MVIVSHEQASRALDPAALIDALRHAFQQPPVVPLRHTHRIGAPGPDVDPQDAPSYVNPGEALGTSLIMPAWNDRYYGVKIVNIFPENTRQGLPGLHACYLLFDARTGVPLAQMDGDVITAHRTACAAALGAAYLASEQSENLLIVGAGRVASLLANAFSAVRPIRKVRIWNVREASAQRLADRLRLAGYDAQAVPDLEQAVRASDIVSCATLSTVPLIRRDWLAPHAHLDLIGSFTPDMQEAHPDCFAGAGVYVDTAEALQKSGDILRAVQAGDFTPEALRGTLQALCQGSVPGRTKHGERTVFKAVGTALEDLAAATLIWENRAQP